MLATLLASFAAFSQEPASDVQSEIDAIEPSADTGAETAVDTSAEPAVDTSREIAGVEDLEPGVPSDVLAADASRSYSSGQVMDRMSLESIEIVGNQELPKVLYIVPWQNAEPGDLMGKPVNTLLDEVLAPIDREEFVRRVDYHGDLYGENEE
jgi:hypothetical protein